MIQHSKHTDELRAAGTIECWCLHGTAGAPADLRSLCKNLAEAKISTRAVDLWRFLECQAMPLSQFGAAFNADASTNVFRGNGRALLGYSLGARLALHALLEPDHPWQAAILIGAHPGLEDPAERCARAAADAEWASKALSGPWQDFMTAWEAQPVLAGQPVRDAPATSRLALRRREIARSFVDWSLGAQQALWSRLPEIQIPVLWVVGEQDEKFRPLAERAVSLMPHATLAVAPDAGHRVPWDAEVWLAKRISDFLQSGL